MALRTRVLLSAVFVLDACAHLTFAQTITEFPLPPGSAIGNGPLRITAGPDGNLWFTEAFVSKVGAP